MYHVMRPPSNTPTPSHCIDMLYIYLCVWLCACTIIMILVGMSNPLSPSSTHCSRVLIIVICILICTLSSITILVCIIVLRVIHMSVTIRSNSGTTVPRLTLAGTSPYPRPTAIIDDGWPSVASSVAFGAAAADPASTRDGRMPIRYLALRKPRRLCPKPVRHLRPRSRTSAPGGANVRRARLHLGQCGASSCLGRRCLDQPS